MNAPETLQARTPSRRNRLLPWIARAVFALAAYAVAACLLPVFIERIYLVIPPVFAFEAVVLALRKDRPAFRRRLAVVVVLALGLAGVAAIDYFGPTEILQPFETTRMAYGLTAVVLVARWVWMGLHAVVMRLFRVKADGPLPGRIAARSVAMVLLALFLDAYLLALLQIHWARRVNPDTPRRLRLDYSDVAWSSRDGTMIRAWFVPAPGATRTAIVCHGVGAYKADMLEFIYALHQGGFNVLAPDLRSHGDSDGHTVTYGAKEKWDIIAGVDWLRENQPEAARRIAGVGWSMGAASLIMAAGEDTRIEALHLDAAYARTFDIARVIARSQPPVVRAVGLYLGTAIGSLEAGTNLFTLAPLAVLDRIAPRPIMLVHGTDDTVIPIEQGRLLFATAREPKAWHEVDGAGHCQTLSIESPTYERRMLDFLNQAIPPEDSD